MQDFKFSLVLIGALVFLPMLCFAQNPLLQKVMIERVEQDSSNWHIQLPSVSVVSEQSPEALTSWITQEDGNLLFSFSEIPSLNKDFIWHTWANYRYLGLAYTRGNFTIGLDICKQIESHHQFSDEWFELVKFGNIPLADQIVDLRFQSTLFSYQKNSVSLSYRRDKWNIGLAAAYLNGRSDLKVTTDQFDYQLSSDGFTWQLDADLEVQSTSLQGLDDLSNTSFTFPILETPSFSAKNIGFSVDFWATYQLSDDWTLAAQVRDLGFINWTDNAVNYRRIGTTDFNGFDLKSIIIQQDEIGVIDTLNAFLDLSADSMSYRQNLASSVELASTYKLNKQVDLLGSAMYKHGFYTAIIRVSAGARYYFNEIFAVHGIYSFDNHTPFILDLGLSLDVGPFYFLASASNPWLLSNGLLADYYAWQFTSGLKF